MTFSQARAILASPLRFGDAEQIEARAKLEPVAEVVAWCRGEIDTMPVVDSYVLGEAAHALTTFRETGRLSLLRPAEHS